MITLHIGVRSGRTRLAHIAGNNARRYGLEVGNYLNMPRESAVIDGTWAEWGPEDRDSAANGLHVAIRLDGLPDLGQLEEMRWRLRMATAGARLVDVAYLTPARDDSTKTHVIDWSTPGQVYIYATDKASVLEGEGATS